VDPPPLGRLPPPVLPPLPAAVCRADVPLLPLPLELLEPLNPELPEPLNLELPDPPNPELPEPPKPELPEPLSLELLAPLNPALPEPLNPELLDPPNPAPLVVCSKVEEVKEFASAASELEPMPPALN